MSYWRSYGTLNSVLGLISKLILRILITGGLGYLGARLAHYLSYQKHKVTVATRAHFEDYKYLPDVTISNIDWSDDESINQACKGYDIVIHAAGMNSDACASDPINALQFNGVATAKLLKSAISANVSRFIYLSTAHVYSQSLSGFFNEGSCARNLHPYATTHKAGEDAVLSCSEKGEINGVVLRISNAFGTPIDPDTNCWELLVNDLCLQAAKLNKIKLKTSGVQYRNFLPIQGLCKTVEFFLSYIDKDYSDESPIYNVGSSSSMTVYDMAKLVALCYQEKYGKKILIERNNNSSMPMPNLPPLMYSVDKLFKAQGDTHDNLKIEILSLFEFCKLHQGK